MREARFLPHLLLVGLQIALLLITRFNIVVLALTPLLSLIVLLVIKDHITIPLLTPVIVICLHPYILQSATVKFGVALFPFDITLLALLCIVSLRKMYHVETINFDFSVSELLMLLFMLSTMLSASIGWIRGYDERVVYYDLRTNLYYLGAFLFAASFRNRNDLVRIVPILLVAAILGSISGILYVTFSSYRLVATEVSLFGFRRLISPNESIYGILTLISLSVYPFIHDNRLKTLNILAILFSLLALIWTLTRGTWIGFIFGLLFLIVRFWRQYGFSAARKTAIIPLMLLFLIASYLIFTGKLPAVLRVIGRVSTLFVLRYDPSTMNRFTEWQESIKLFMKHPLFGTGLGFQYTIYYIMRGYRTIPYVHNSYFYFLTKMGIFGLFSFLAMILSFVVETTRKVSKEKNHLLGGFIHGLIASILLMIVKCFTTYHFNTDTVTVFLGFVLGIMVYYIKNDT